MRITGPFALGLAVHVRVCRGKVVMGGRKSTFAENIPWAIHLYYTPVNGFSQQPSEVLMVILVMIIIIIIISWI